MPADVVVGSELALAGAHHEDAFTRDLDHQVVARGGQLLFAAGAEPFPPENALLLPGKDLFREVELASESALHHFSPPSGP